MFNVWSLTTLRLHRTSVSPVYHQNNNTERWWNKGKVRPLKHCSVISRGLCCCSKAQRWTLGGPVTRTQPPCQWSNTLTTKLSDPCVSPSVTSLMTWTWSGERLLWTAAARSVEKKLSRSKRANIRQQTCLFGRLHWSDACFFFCFFLNCSFLFLKEEKKKAKGTYQPLQDFCFISLCLDRKIVSTGFVTVCNDFLCLLSCHYVVCSSFFHFE